MPGYVCPPPSGCEVNPNQAMGSLEGGGTGTDRHPILGKKKGETPRWSTGAGCHRATKTLSGYQDPVAERDTADGAGGAIPVWALFFLGVGVGKLDVVLGEDEQQRLKAVGSGDVSVSARNGIPAAG